MRRVILCAVMSVAVLVSMLVAHAYPLWTGARIALLVEPVDPRNLFRGDYVSLSYDISRLSISDAPEAPDRSASRAARVRPIGAWWEDAKKDRADFLGAPRRGTALYVQLVPGETSIAGVPASYRAVSVSDAPVPNAVNLRGRVIYKDGRVRPNGAPSAGMPIDVQMEYGIEAFFVEEGTGHAIEDAVRSGQPVVATIAVTSGGRARVVDVRSAPWRGATP